MTAAVAGPAGSRRHRHGRDAQRGARPLAVADGRRSRRARGRRHDRQRDGGMRALRLAQLGGGLLGRDVVEVHAGAELEAAAGVRRGTMSMRQQKRSASRGAVRTHRLSGGLAPKRRAQPRQRRRAAAPRRSGPSSSKRSRRRRGASMSWYGQPRRVGAPEHRLVVDRDDPLAAADLLLRRGPRAGWRPSCASA